MSCESHLTCWSMVVFALRLRIAFKWMVRAFSGYLSTDQLLLLWDRVLGYDSLEIIAGKSSYGSHICLDTVITWLPLVFQPFYFVLLSFLPHMASPPTLPCVPLSRNTPSPNKPPLPPVLAAAVFAFRAENLMEVTSLASAEVRPSQSTPCVNACVRSPDPRRLPFPTYSTKSVNSCWWATSAGSPDFCMHSSGNKKSWLDTSGSPPSLPACFETKSHAAIFPPLD